MKKIVPCKDLLKQEYWQTFDLLLTPEGFCNFTNEINSSNQKVAQVYVHVCDEGPLKHEVLRIGKARHGVIDRWVKQSWGHGNTFLWSIGESERYGSYAGRYPNYLAFFACLTGLKTKLHVRSCETIEIMNQIENHMIKCFNPIWECYKKAIKGYLLQNPEIKQRIAKYGGAEKEIIDQRTGGSSLAYPIPDVSNFRGTTARRWDFT